MPRPIPTNQTKIDKLEREFIMFKKVIAAVAAFAIAAAMLFAVESSDVRELNAVVTESSDGIVVMDVDMPNGQVHEWAFYGDGYAVGDNFFEHRLVRRYYRRR